MPSTHTFETTVTRTVGNLSTGAECEYQVEAGYQIIGGKAVLTRWCIIGDTYPLTARELEQLDDEAADHAAEVLAEEGEDDAVEMRRAA